MGTIDYRELTSTPKQRLLFPCGKLKMQLAVTPPQQCPYKDSSNYCNAIELAIRSY